MPTELGLGLGLGEPSWGNSMTEHSLCLIMLKGCKCPHVCATIPQISRGLEQMHADRTDSGEDVKSASAVKTT